MTAARPWSVPAGTALVVTAAPLAPWGRGSPPLTWRCGGGSWHRGSSCRARGARAARTVGLAEDLAWSVPLGAVLALATRAWASPSEHRSRRRGPAPWPSSRSPSRPCGGGSSCAVVRDGGPGEGVGGRRLTRRHERRGLGRRPVGVPAECRPSAPLGARRHVLHRPLGRARAGDGEPPVPDGAGGPVPLPLVFHALAAHLGRGFEPLCRRDPPAAAHPPPRLRRDGGRGRRVVADSPVGRRGRCGGRRGARVHATGRVGPLRAASTDARTATAPASTPSGSTGSTRRARPSAGSRRSGSSPWRRGCSGAGWRPVTSCSSSCSGCWRPG